MHVFSHDGDLWLAGQFEGRDPGIEVNWIVAMRLGERKALDKSTPMGAILDRLEQTKARIRAGRTPVLGDHA